MKKSSDLLNFNWYVTGDLHRDFSRFKAVKEIAQNPQNAIIILGDVGINLNNPKEDAHMKNYIQRKFRCRFYCVRGNHEMRPEDVEGMELIYDPAVNGEVYIQQKWQNIRYFKDYGIYTINNYRVAVIGGAYSVDKEYRLLQGLFYNPKELLTFSEQQLATAKFTEDNCNYHFIFSHTCPLSWEPTDLFLNFINQKTVNKSMELWLDKMRVRLNFKVWCFGHYHADRMERPHVEQFYRNIETLDAIYKRWDGADELLWYMPKSPQYYWKDK